MHFVISREALLKPLQMVSGVVERRQTLPVLSNVLMVLDGSELSLTGTDLEVELIGRVPVDQAHEAGAVTVPARKLLDICKSLADDANVEFSLSDNKLTLKSGRSRYTLTTLPASEFPSVDEEPDTFSLSISQAKLHELLESTSFAMAQQDVRYYLNGMLFEVAPDFLRVVATDGHRLAMETLNMDNPINDVQQLILPRKGILELSRLLGDEQGEITLTFGQNHIRAKVPAVTFTSKLVDGKFPDYNRVLPKGGNKVLIGECQELRQAFSRAAILSNEKYRGVRVMLSNGELKILANNPEQEEAEEVVSVEYEGDSLEIGFNVSYLIDVLSTLSSKKARITLSDPNSSALIEAEEGSDALYVVMPMRL
ncbi:MAG: DNA polymerase III subunit beta [Gammaproteobacteria bacterium]|jgi:DNA polymerase-3 subunit beta|nr:DNA polymerase III subunit beta [Gammaproteobacteria bacterium]MBT3861080.1 DNA polymerase III subunit beta [Gammaproteobacteria bacterium]MBT3987710.1 DNA polymerase III subunit beta [Gammaproteobacteria bacterium]MBT4255620.1 DNA polymerase III subunit beta [Gammaproteobacteria bacterium]MBT4582710.1 DNA polymerase III subunit beta [Gammaproteobacteria bacterium]